MVQDIEEKENKMARFHNPKTGETKVGKNPTEAFKEETKSKATKPKATKPKPNAKVKKDS